MCLPVVVLTPPLHLQRREWAKWKDCLDHNTFRDWWIPSPLSHPQGQRLRRDPVVGDDEEWCVVAAVDREPWVSPGKPEKVHVVSECQGCKRNADHGSRNQSNRVLSTHLPPMLFLVVCMFVCFTNTVCFRIQKLTCFAPAPTSEIDWNKVNILRMGGALEISEVPLALSCGPH